MQRPTHPRLHLRDARDAHIVFEAVRLGLLKPVTRRLNETERATYIASGAVFVWEEADDELGLKRWTDGRVWSQSRMREPYLFYDEKLPDEAAFSGDRSVPRSPGTYRFVDGMTRGAPLSSAQSHFERSGDHRGCGLIKQAYSAFVQLPGSPSHKQRKWHLTAYFTYSDLSSMPTADQDPLLRSISVPAGIYRSGKARSRSNSEALSLGTLSLSGPPTPVPGPPSRVASPTPYVLPALHSIGGRPVGNRIHVGIDGRMAEDQRLIRVLNAHHNK